MRHTFSKRALGMLLGLAVVAPVGAAITAGPAAATTDVIAIGGSDTTQDVMGAILTCGPTGACTGEPNVYNLKVPPNMGNVDNVIPADTHCNQVTYNGVANPSKVLPPFGSGEGRTALVNSVAKTYPNAAANAGTTGSFGGCIDVARTSSGPSGSATLADPVQNQYYGYAIDAVGWGTASLNAPQSLTLQQLRDVYQCEVNDWAEVGGKAGPIVRVLPQTGSGTRNFFVGNVLGLATNYVFPTADPTGGAAAHTCAPVVDVAPVLVEENKGTELLRTQLRANYQSYILPYSAGLWVYQANNSSNPSLDKRAGVRPGGLVNNDPVTGVTGAPVAWPVRWVGSEWRLNDGTIIEGSSLAGVTSDAQFDSTLTAAAGTFTGRAGQYLQGTVVNDGTVIQSVNGDGSVATISPGAKAAGTATLTAGWSVISEGNPHILSASNIKYAGVRYVYNILHTDSPSYGEARGLLGFDSTTAAGALSPMCDGSNEGAINANGFLALPLLDRNGAAGNNQLRSCVVRIPGTPGIAG